ncbi:unnamed protein product, partial [Rotaria sp. Silwood1]
YDISANWLSCTIATFLSDVALIIRVLWHKHIRLRQPIRWRKHRKMVIQLLSVSIFTSSLSTPLLIFYLIRYFGNLSVNIDPKVQYSLLYLLLFSILSLPFIMILSLPQEYWLSKWKRMFCNRRRRTQIAVAATIPNTRALRTDRQTTRIVPVKR